MRTASVMSKTNKKETICKLDKKLGEGKGYDEKAGGRKKWDKSSAAIKILSYRIPC